MKKAYVILAHGKPGQLCRLVQKLDDNASDFFIHIDKKIPISGFRGLLQLRNTQLVKRVRLQWAGFSIVEAILNALEAIQQSGRQFDRIILLSGQDYPIKSNAWINQYLRTSPFSVFLEYFLLPNHSRWQPGGGMYRVNKYYFGPRIYQRYPAKACNFLGRFVPFIRRRLPPPLKPFAGSMWWIIDMYALNYILDYVKKNPRYSSFHKFTFAPDEVFFHTILMNAADKKLAGSIINTNKRLIKWEDITAAHPNVLMRNDMKEILLSDALFARKFDQEKDPSVLDLVDLHCLSDKYHSN